MVHYYRHRSDHLCSRFSFQDMHAASPRSNEPSLPGTWTRIYLDLFDYYDSSTGSLEIDYLIWDKKRVKHMHVGNSFFSRTCVARVALREEKRRHSIGRGETPRSDEQATKRTTHALHMTCRPAQLYTTTQSSGRCLPPRRSAYTKQLGKPSRFAATRRAKQPPARNVQVQDRTRCQPSFLSTLNQTSLLTTHRRSKWSIVCSSCEHRAQGAWLGSPWRSRRSDVQHRPSKASQKKSRQLFGARVFQSSLAPCNTVWPVNNTL
jgi:hypothetical protein